MFLEYDTCFNQRLTLTFSFCYKWIIFSCNTFSSSVSFHRTNRTNLWHIAGLTFVLHVWIGEKIKLLTSSCTQLQENNKLNLEKCSWHFFLLWGGHVGVELFLTFSTCTGHANFCSVSFCSLSYRLWKNKHIVIHFLPLNEACSWLA